MSAYAYDDEYEQAYAGEPDNKPPVVTRQASSQTPQRAFSATIVATYPCRATGCKNGVAVTQGALDARDAFNRILAARGEAPIADNEVAFCDRCARLYEQKRAEHAEKVREAIAKFVIELRDPTTPPQRIAVAEDYIAKRANDGKTLVRLLAKERNTQPQTQVRARRGTW